MILRSEPDGSGAWTVVAAGEALLALPEGDAGGLDGVAERLAGPDGFRVVVEGLAARGIAQAPEFALVEVGGDAVRVALRGPAEAETPGERVSGRGVTTWTERVLPGATDLVLSVPGSRWSITAGAVGAVAEAPPGGPAGEPAATVPERVDPRVDPGDEGVPHATLAPPHDADPRSAAAPRATSALVVEEAEPHAFLFGDLDLPAAPAAEPAYVLELPGGAVEPLTAPLLVGRSPSDPGRGASGGPPRLVAVAADDKDISRTHARVEVAGGAIVVTDLDSKNGTSVAMPGSTPRTLRAGEPAVVLPGTVIDLGGGVAMTVREDG